MSGVSGHLRFLRLLAALLVALLAVPAFGIGAASAGAPRPDDPVEEEIEETPPAVVVCKYVATPEDGERLSHVVIVAESELPDWDGVFPAEFAEAQGRSLAVRHADAGEQAEDVPLTDCPAAEESPVEPPADEELPAEEADDAEQGEAGSRKVVVCKYVRTPGTAEVLSHIVIVAESALADGFDGTFPFPFSDAHFNSLALRWAEDGEQAHDVPLTDCPTAPAEPTGQLAIVSKKQFELIDGDWVESDGVADFGDLVKYVVTVRATGPKTFHDVVVTDYVPGFNPGDTTSTVDASLVADSAVCTGSLACSVSVEDGLVTWQAGTVQDAEGAVEMVVRIPDAPDSPEFDEEGVHTATLWNEGYLAWDEVVEANPVPRGSTAVARLAVEHHTMTSNEVVLDASITRDAPVSPPNTGPDPEEENPGLPELPNTGSPAFLGLLAALGAGLLGLGLVLAGRRRGAASR